MSYFSLKSGANGFVSKTSALDVSEMYSLQILPMMKKVSKNYQIFFDFTTSHNHFLNVLQIRSKTGFHGFGQHGVGIVSNQILYRFI